MAKYNGGIRFSDDVFITVVYDSDTPELTATVTNEKTGETVIEAVSESN